ncbi:MAG: hypothetical protein M1813_005215 [Trichoglossum hirsutum]|nr:MAG: hypothetical protein M1813_005215 [Trichoglossum hirsutum]
MSGSIAKKAKGTFNPFPEENEAPRPNENKEAGQKSTLKKTLTGLGSKPAVLKKEGTGDEGKSAKRDKPKKKSSSKCVAF